MSSIFGGVRTVIIFNPHFVTDVPPQARGRSRREHRSRRRRPSSPTTRQGEPPTSAFNNDLTTATTTVDNNATLPDSTRSEPHQQYPPPSSPQGTTTPKNYIPVVLETAADFPICDDRSDIDPDHDGDITSNAYSSSSSSALCTPVSPPSVQKTGREPQALKKTESPFVPSPPPPPHAQPHPHIKQQKKQRRKHKGASSDPQGTLPMSSDEDLSVSSSCRAVRHLNSSGGPLFALLAPSPAPSSSSSGSSCATSLSHTCNHHHEYHFRGASLEHGML